jgi:hypothetical protein
MLLLLSRARLAQNLQLKEQLATCPGQPRFDLIVTIHNTPLNQLSFIMIYVLSIIPVP